MDVIPILMEEATFSTRDRTRTKWKPAWLVWDSTVRHHWLVSRDRGYKDRELGCECGAEKCDHLDAALPLARDEQEPPARPAPNHPPTPAWFD